MRFLIASLFLLSLISAGQTAPVVTLHDLKEADTLGADLYANSGATGMVLVMVRGDQVYFKGYGESVPGSQEVPSLNSELRLCSLTKIFTTDLLAKLVADGRVHLDDTLKKYAPESAVVPERDAPITLEELATHTAGLEREIGTAPRRTPHFSYPDYEMRWHWLASAELKFTPGTKAFYSNVGFDLLSDALAKASHTPYDALLDKRTLKPLKMWNTTFYPNPGQCERLMTGAHEEGPCTITANTEGSSGLYSTPADMENFLRYLVGAGAPAQADDAHGVYLLPSKLAGQYGLDHAGKPSGIGLGWMHVGGNDDVEHLIEKTGGGAGFTTYIAFHPASHTALFVAVTEGPGRRWKPGFNLFKASNNGLLALAGLPPLADAPRRRIVRQHTARTTMRVRAKNRGTQKRGVRAAQRTVGASRAGV
ncbi:MAG TPA: D-alanyl-D-alanine-carboxypeptidase/endopeptidase AmpH [Terracidiphilus sp.]|nr:D-alanyl-D-alanine-carboxypeptidase/endopeptidase AmpH [Terracidiphilus sp.]